MSLSDIVIKGAREHNLRDLDLVLPRNQLICFSGVSGSGKSSLAFDTLYAEGQRRYIESLSSFARQFLGQLPKPEVDQISGLSPSISISQKTAGQNPRSTVGTITEIYDFLRVLYARVATGYCPQCDRPITAQTRQQIIDRIETLPEKTPFLILAPVIRGQKGEHRDLFADLLKKGFIRARVDGNIVRLGDNLRLDRQMRHDIEVVIDRLVQSGPSNRSRLSEAVERALAVGDGNLLIVEDRGQRTEDRGGEAGKGEGGEGTEPSGAAFSLSSKFACTHCNLSFDPPSPQMFSFNSPQGMCSKCSGLGEIHSFDPNLLIPDPKKSFQQGCIEPLGKWKEMGRWKRHIFQGVAETLERLHQLPPHTVLESAWEELPRKIRDAILWGTGSQHITFTWRNGPSGHKWGGEYEGIIPKMLQQHRETKSRMQRLAMEKYMSVIPCGYCKGERLNEQARAFKIETASEAPAFAEEKRLSLPRLCSLAISEVREFFSALNLSESGRIIAEEAVKEIRNRLGFLTNVGLEYLSLSRTAPTLSGGELQRIRLAGQIGSGLVGVLYILDEPSIGLHPRDNDRLLATLGKLRDQGNTVIVVEHDEETMLAADHLVDFGPGPGVHGGHIVAQGNPWDLLEDRGQRTEDRGQEEEKVKSVAKRRGKENEEAGTGNKIAGQTSASESSSLSSVLCPLSSDSRPPSSTLQFLSGEEKIDIPATRRSGNGKTLTIRNARQNNLKGIDVGIPLGKFVCVTGVSGSGKSSLVNDILVEALNLELNRGLGDPGAHDGIDGLEHLDKMISIDQSPIGRGPHSNPATYTKVFDEIRKLFAEVPDAKLKGYSPGRFSFNVAGGRCEACEGRGSKKLEMDFLADIWVPCTVCNGRRFNQETLSVKFKGKSIFQVLDMDVEEALEHFENIPKIRHYLQTLSDVGLGYMKLGQPSPTLSGGEAQRIKLAKELVKRSTGKTLYLLDEPTTGLHFADIKMLLKVLHDFVDAGNTVLVVEHNLDVIKTADWIIDLGPEGGEAGGYVVAEGTPEEIIKNDELRIKNEDSGNKFRKRTSYTARSLAKVLNRAKPGLQREKSKEQEKLKGREKSKDKKKILNSQFLIHNSIVVRGAEEHNLKNVSLEIPREQMTVFCGPSGSGKSSLAMDTVYAEGQRRYVESLSSYARQFVGQMQKPKVEHIEGLSPAIAIEQKAASHSPRSTVGTVTEIHDYLRVLFARLGVPYCPECDVPIGTQSLDEIVAKIMLLDPDKRLLIAAPLNVEVGQQYETLWKRLREDGYIRVRIDGITYPLESVPEIDRRRRHAVEVIVDRIVLNEDRSGRGRIADSVENALELGQGVIHIIEVDPEREETDWKTTKQSRHLSCEKCGRSFEPLTPHHFSFNSPLGWCPHCEGLGVQSGANPMRFLHDPKLTLAEGAVALFPNVAGPMFAAMLQAFSKQTGIPTDIPFEQLDARFRRLIFHGTGEMWFAVEDRGKRIEDRKKKKSENLSSILYPLSSFKFQFKGLYPALEEAARLVPQFRGRLEYMVDEVECSVCLGSRLRDDAAAVRFLGETMDQICRRPLGKLIELFENWEPDETERKIAGDLLEEIRNRLRFLIDVGLEYLTLSRPSPSLSGGETQRIRLAAQIGSGLVGVLYVLDEPTIGLHPRDNGKLIAALRKLRDLGNTMLLVEHDKEVIAGADMLVDFGPQAGKFGGEIVAAGNPAAVVKKKGSVTGPYLSGKKSIPIPKNRRLSPDQAAACPVR